MTATRIDHVETLEATEKFGSLIRLVRLAHVVGLTDTDYQVLFSALEEAGIPAAGSALTGNANLILTERNPKVIDKSIVEVTLVYEHFHNEGQSFEESPLGVVFVKSRTALNQETTNKYVDPDSLEEKLIEVKHTFPDGTSDYTDFDGNTLPADPDYPGEEIKQGGEITVTVPQEVITAEGIIAIDTPWVVSQGCVNNVNYGDWMGGEDGTWKCVSADWYAWDVESSPKRYKFTFEFQYNVFGWDPYVVFNDARNGKPPVGLIEDEGYKKIRYYTRTNFDFFLGGSLEGA